MSNDNLTPMIRQYLAVKEQYPDTILLYRIGDFYEMFFDDAIEASKLLEITLTSRNKNEGNPIPLCGVPHHSVEPYIAKLIAKGKKVAVCDQVEDPKLAKGIVKREVTKVITPGIILDSSTVDGATHNFIAAVAPKGYLGSNNFGLAIADVSTGYFVVSQFDTEEGLVEEISRLEPKEILLPQTEQKISSKIKNYSYDPVFTTLTDINFETNAIHNLEGSSFIAKNSPSSAKAASAIWLYISHTQKGEPRHIKKIELASNTKAIQIDESTKRNLELFSTMTEGSLKGSLFWLLNKTSTAFGSRRLKDWMLYPLIDVEKINERLNAVEFLLENDLYNDISKNLEQVSDIERISARIAMGSANARDMISLKESLKKLPSVIEILLGSHCEQSEAIQVKHKQSGDRSVDQRSPRDDRKMGGCYIQKLLSNIDPLSDIVDKIEKTVIDEPSMSIKDGGIIKSEFNKELDELRSISGGGKDSIAAIETKERARTGISSLKVKYNKVFGYYIEITNAHKDKVPTDYIRKQTLVNAERYITEELKQYEEKVLSAEDKIKALEYELFCNLRESLASEIYRIAKTADSLSKIDVLNSFAIIANDYSYKKPEINNSKEIHILDGRHPIIERLNPIERFVPNDVNLDDKENQLLIITGPNMAGKSTAMRQTAIIVLMAQIGSFVPVKQAKIGVVDRIFTRIGASDALSKGQSTFMVEMSEAANILTKATDRSLIIIDEIGRGTSTFDGLSLAWAVAEDLHDRVKARTLFATHYHQLTELALTKPGIKNFNIAVKEWNSEIIFLRKLVKGATSRSYGIQVAKLAGLPEHVISRSTEVLNNLESGELDEKGKPRLAMHETSGEKQEDQNSQLNLFNTKNYADIIEEISNLDTSTITPIESLNLLYKMKQKIES